MKNKYQNYLIKQVFFYFKSIVAVAIITTLVFYVWRMSLRPPRTDRDREIAKGIIYQRKVFSTLRPYIVHIVEIDLGNSNIRPFVTPSDIQQPHGSNLAMTTSDFVEKFDLILGVNGSFFYPFEENTPWDYYPRSREAVKALGSNIANGKEYGKVGKRWNTLCFDRHNLARITLKQKCPLRTLQGVAGKEIIVRDSQNVADNNIKAYSRTMAGVNHKGDKLWLVVVDGKQPFYSQGVTLKELADIAVDLGCDRALNLDGGGSSTLVVKQNDGVEVLNAPIHTKIPMRERPVANHLGFYPSAKSN